MRKINKKEIAWMQKAYKDRELTVGQLAVKFRRSRSAIYYYLRKPVDIEKISFIVKKNDLIASLLIVLFVLIIAYMLGYYGN